MKEQVYKQSEKTRKMDEFFYNHCEKILLEEIDKWEDHREFFTKLFDLHEQRIK